MVIRILLFITLLYSSTAFCKHDIKVYYEDIKNGFAMMVDNNEYCPISIELTLTLKNLRSVKGSQNIFVVPARSKGFVITDLIAANKNKPYRFSYKYKSSYGNHNQKKYNMTYKYYLPFQKHESYEVFQGYNGKQTHQNENALDFTMPIGTPVVAARDGVVVKVVAHNNRTCYTKDCMKYNNLVIVYHEDGTFAEYTHIKKDGAKVAVGDTVTKGQVIAESGNVGYSSGPHLHFVVFLQRISGRKTLKTRFLTGNGKRAEFLMEKKRYSRLY